ncbi:MAG: hypothetical protein FWC09_10010 [Lachnospiraceae bacterium]|nr:hypothetical protein [Lachnospiraceae bacterium]
MQSHQHIQKGFRRFQLKAIGVMAILIGPAVLFDTTIVYGLPFPRSISETATIANQTSPILPFCLGALALFSLTYAFIHNYDRLDQIFTIGIFIGFTIVAMQMCASPFITDTSRVGILGISENISSILHNLGAVIGFCCMILWIIICFTKSDMIVHEQTKEKRFRNNCYLYLGIAMILSMLFFLLDYTGIFGDDFPVVFVAECFMLILGGIACLIKGGVVFRDK